MSSLGMVTLVVDNYDRAIDYFTKYLGFSLVEDTKMSPAKRWVVVAPDAHEGARILLALAATPSQAVAVGNQTGGRVGYFLYTSEFDAEYSRMKKAGVEFIESPRLEIYGKVVVFKDLYGNKWDFIERNLNY